jgi:PAS domain S-box-containing protein
VQPALPTRNVQRLVRAIRDRQHESEIGFRLLFEEEPDACFLCDQEGRFVDGNKAMETLLGYPRRDFIGRNFSELGIMDDGEAFRALQEVHLAAEGKPHRPMEKQLRRRDGQRVMVEIAAAPITLAKSTLLLGSARDITRRHQAERELRESEQRFRVLFNSLSDPVLILDGEDMRVLHANQEALYRYGYTREGLSGLRMDDLATPKESARMPQLIESIRRAGTHVFETEHRKASAHCFPVEASVRLMEYDARPAFLAVCRDITERVKSAAAIRESEEKYRRLFETESNAILLFDAASWNLVDANQAALSLYGYEGDEIRHLRLSDVSAEPEELETLIDVLAETGPQSIFHGRHRTKDGTVFPVDISVCAFPLQGRQMICEVVRDISERMLHEQQLLHQRMELRRLAAELALAEDRERRRIAGALHDEVGQLLSTCKFRLDAICQRGLAGDLDGGLNKVGEILDRAMERTRALVFDLSSPILDQIGLPLALEQLCADMTHDGRMQFEYHGPQMRLEMAEAQRSTLYRAVRELMVNALKHAHARQAQVTLANLGDRIRIVVDDDGIGFDAAQAGRGFSPSGGFGLFNLREHLRHVGGELTIRSVPGSGTRVIVEAPLEASTGP